MSETTTNFATRASVAIALSLAGMLTMATPALAVTNGLAEQAERLLARSH